MPSTLETASDYISDARTLLQDVIVPYRYDDASLLVGLNVTLLEARRLRPDLFIYHHNGRVAHFTAVDDTELHMEEPFRLSLVYGLVGHALARDQEDYQDARATAFLQLFYSGLMGLGLVPITGGGGGARANG